MYRSRWTPSLVVVFLVAGCAAKPGEHPPTTSPSASDIPAGLVKLELARCAEVDWLVERPAGSVRPPPPLVVDTLDPAGATTQTLVNALRCESVTLAGAPVAPMGYYAMASVAPAEGLRVPNATSYLWLYRVATVDDGLRAFLAERGVEAVNATVDVRVEDVATLPKASGAVSVASATFSESAETRMAGPPRDGRAGSLGLYTGNASVPVRGHLVEYSDYRFYTGGTGVLREGPAKTARPISAFHNFVYSVTFTFDVAGVARTAV